MRKFYKSRRNAVVSLLENCSFSDKLTIQEQDAGLHFLLNVATSLSDQSLTEKLAALGIRVRAFEQLLSRPVGRPALSGDQLLRPEGGTAGGGAGGDLSGSWT